MTRFNTSLTALAVISLAFAAPAVADEVTAVSYETESLIDSSNPDCGLEHFKDVCLMPGPGVTDSTIGEIADALSSIGGATSDQMVESIIAANGWFGATRNTIVSKDVAFRYI